MQKVIVIDYGMGNLHSVQKALSFLGAAPVLSQNPEEIQAAEKLILPGVGAFADAMAELKQKNLVQAIKQAVKKQTPLMGICLGMQLLFEQSSEGGLHEGLGLMPGEITRFEIQEKVPHMGWNSLDVVRPGRLLHGIEPGAEFYFVHSYYVEPAPELVMATTVYGKEFCSVYGRDGLWAVQCHLEKSGRPGLTVLRNFYDYCDEVRHA